MPISPRSFVLAAVAVGPLVLLAGCGNDASGARTTLVPVQPSSYVVQEPVPTTTAPPTTVAPPTPEAGQISPTEQSHTIVSGDSIYRISGLYGITPDDLINFNEWSDGLNHVLIPGQTVRIPPNAIVPGTGSGDATGDGGAGTGTPEAPTQTEAPQGCTHVIAAGENPTKVANKYEITVDQLREVNPGVIDTFIVGQTLVIPPGGAC